MVTKNNKLPPFPHGLIPALRALRAACDDPNLWWCKSGDYVARKALAVEKESHRSLATLRTAMDYGFTDWLKVGNSFRWKITSLGRRALAENGYG